MWKLYRTAKTFNQRPSRLLRDDGYGVLHDPFWALQFDNAVALVGGTLEAALEEMQETGSGKNKKFKPRYTIKQLLDPDFRLGDDRTMTPERLAGMGVFD